MLSNFGGKDRIFYTIAYTELTVGLVQVTQLKAAEQMKAVASEEQQKEANLKEALEEQLAQVNIALFIIYRIF